MAEFQISSHEDNVGKVEKTRILSDNYNAYIIAYDGIKRTHEFNLSDYGLKDVSWEARDEIKIFKPCTRREEIAHVFIKGFDIELRWAKNSSDLMKIFFDQHIAYYGGINLNQDVLTDQNDRSNKLLIQKRTLQDQRGDITTKNNIKGTTSSVFNKTEKKNNPTYITPRFDLQINIQHYNTKVETILFKSVAFYRPTQRTSENGAEIDESIKCYAPTAQYLGSQAHSPQAESIIHQALSKIMQPNVREQDLAYHERKIINQDNLNIYKNSGRFQF